MQSLFIAVTSQTDPGSVKETINKTPPLESVKSADGEKPVYKKAKNITSTSMVTLTHRPTREEMRTHNSEQTLESNAALCTCNKTI